MQQLSSPTTCCCRRYFYALASAVSLFCLLLASIASSSANGSETFANTNWAFQQKNNHLLTSSDSFISSESLDYQLMLVGRTYYLNDQRVQWSGQESTFGVEAAILPVIRQQCGEWDTEIGGEFFLNQRYDKNILVDTPERRSYVANFEPDVFEISTLYISASRGNWQFDMGKIRTPFGRTYFPLFTNSRIDAPFIRTEAIHWRETGFLARYQPGRFIADVAIVNGSEDRDTNSSKSLISRLGLEGDNWAVGSSVKAQDGTGSETQKIYNNHVGLDAMIHHGRYTLSGEVIYDEYGFRRPGFDPDDITWYRSIYYRDLNFADGVPITGVGYYANLNIDCDRWFIQLNYGAYHPKQIGNLQHDQIQQRGIVKIAYAATPWIQPYAITMIENGGYPAQAGRPRRGTVVLAGLQAAF